MKNLFICCFVTMMICSSVQADIVDFTEANGVGENQNTAASLLNLTGVSLGSGVTADIAVTSLGTEESRNAGLAVSGQFGPGEELTFTFSNISAPAGVTINDFNLNSYLWTDPTGRGYLFDGSSPRESGFDITIDGGTTVVGSVLDGDNANLSASTPANASSLNLAFSTGLGVGTFELAPTTAVTFTNSFTIEGIDPAGTGNDDNFFVQGFDITANVTTAVPEPSSLALLGLGSLCLIARRRK